ncbi:MAG: tetratricopeptide repeat protein [Gemmatimonadaceae bacterium]|nr:tetratricopeptide repeat protein [Gemmatimonadaceae bacterium]
MSSTHLTKLKRKATELEQKKQFEKALALYIQVIEEAGRDLDDADLQLFNRVGDLLMRQGNASEALVYYEKAVDMYAERGFLNNAIALCNKILRQSPARTAVYYKLGKISASKGFKADARKNFLEYADRMQKGGNLDEAFRALKEFADLCPDQDDIRLMLAEMLTKENRKPEALEQLEQLYAKLDAEGRAAEARATMDRIKAIDPELTPRSTGAWQAQKSNDLVFLDLGESEYRAARAGTPDTVTPAASVPVVEGLDVGNVGALQGLTITFLPDENETEHEAANAEPVSAVDGLDVITPSVDADGSLGALAELETTEALTPREVPLVPELAIDQAEFVASDEVVPPLEGLANSVVTLTGAHPSLAPLIEAPPLSGEEFGALHLAASHDGADDTPRPHDLSIASSLPLQAGPMIVTPTSSPDTSDPGPGLLEVTPDAWVHAALGSRRDDLSLDRLLTPLENMVIPEVPALAELDLPLTLESGAPQGTAGLLDFELPESSGEYVRPQTADLDLQLGDAAPDALESDVDGLASGRSTEHVVPDEGWAETGDEAAEDVPVTAEHQLPEETWRETAALQEQASGHWPAAPEVDASETDASESDAAEVEASETYPGATDATEAEASEVDAGQAEADEAGAVPVVDAERHAPAAGMSEAAPERIGPNESEPTVEPVVEPTRSINPGWDAEALLSPEFALEASGGETPPPASALDTASLRAEVDDRLQGASDPAAAPEVSSSESVRAAFDEARVELPMIEMESAAYDEPPAAPAADFAVPDAGIDELLAVPPSFGDGQEATGFDPAPLDLNPGSTADDWDAPEVLIDGEWRDEHVGDLVSGEVFVVGERRSLENPPRPAFDDLAAAMLYDGDAQRDRATSADNGHSEASRSTLSFGGTEAQLRRRLELAPGDAAIRRQLGEALLDIGQREEGLNELEHAVVHYEGRNDLASARDIVDVILRVVPLSVRHHQKRVEYAVRSSDRPRLIEAYTELADSLFRCGEPDKARVVYSRVLELSPSSERARFALSMLSDDAGAPRSSDDIPVIETGILRGAPSLTMATLTPEALDALTAHDIAPAAELPYIEDAAPAGAGTPDARDGADAAAGIEPLATIEAAQAELRAAEPSAGDPLDDEVAEAFATPAAREADRRSVELRAVEDWATEQPTSAAPGGDFVDLGDWLRDDAAVKSTRMVARDVAPTGDESADFAEMLHRFKQGLAANVEDEDFASHYDLGVAFKEMGLVDEAIAQFQKSLRGKEHRVRSYEALGQCFVEQGQHQVALALLQRAAETPGTDDQELVGVLYLLGFACESVGRQDDAVRYYQRVFAVDIRFRDVTHRLASLARNPK